MATTIPAEIVRDDNHSGEIVVGDSDPGEIVVGVNDPGEIVRWDNDPGTPGPRVDGLQLLIQGGHKSTLRTCGAKSRVKKYGSIGGSETRENRMTKTEVTALLKQNTPLLIILLAFAFSPFPLLASDEAIHYVSPEVGYSCVVVKEHRLKGKMTAPGQKSVKIDRNEITKMECAILALDDRGRVTKGSLRFVDISDTFHDRLKGRQLEYRRLKNDRVFVEGDSQLEDKGETEFAMGHFRAISDKYSLSEYLSKQELKTSKSLSVPEKYVGEITGGHEPVVDEFKLRPRKFREIDGVPCVEFKVTIEGEARSTMMKSTLSVSGTYVVALETGWPLLLDIKVKTKMVLTNSSGHLVSTSKETQKVEWTHQCAKSQEKDTPPQDEPSEPEPGEPDDK